MAGHNLLSSGELQFIKVKTKRLLAATVQLSSHSAVPCPEVLKLIF
jgi:hypothetical protein